MSGSKHYIIMCHKCYRNSKESLSDDGSLSTYILLHVKRSIKVNYNWFTCTREAMNKKTNYMA